MPSEVGADHRISNRIESHLSALPFDKQSVQIAGQRSRFLHSSLFTLFKVLSKKLSAHGFRCLGNKSSVRLPAPFNRMVQARESALCEGKSPHCGGNARSLRWGMLAHCGGNALTT